MAARNNVTDASASPRLSNPWMVLGLLLAIHVFNFADRFLITGLVGPLKAAFKVDDAFIGLLMGPAFVVLYVALGIPIARLADRTSRVRIIAAGCVMWSACTFITGFATQPWQLLAARIGVGIGEACFVAPAYSLITDYFRPERRGLAFAILGLATYFGQIAGQAGGPAIERAHGWQFAFHGLGGPGVLLGLLALLMIREPPRAAGWAETARQPLAAMLSALGKAPSYWLMIAAFACGTLSGVSFGFWGPELFARSYGIDPVTAKTAFALNFGSAGLLGMLGFGILVDRLTRRSIRWPLRLGSIALFCATVLVLLAVWAPTFALAKLIAIPCGMLGGGWSIGFIATLQYLLPPQWRASATAVFVAITTLTGFLLGPWLSGYVSHVLGNDAQSLRVALSVAVPIGVIGALCGWLAIARFERDRERLAEA